MTLNLRNSFSLLFTATAMALAGCGDSDGPKYINPTSSTDSPAPPEQPAKPPAPPEDETPDPIPVDLLHTPKRESRKVLSAKASVDMALSTATTKALMLSAVIVHGDPFENEIYDRSLDDAPPSRAGLLVGRLIFWGLFIASCAQLLYKDAMEREAKYKCLETDNKRLTEELVRMKHQAIMHGEGGEAGHSTLMPWQSGCPTIES